MNEYNISLGVILDNNSLQRVRTQINNLELDPITVRLDTSQVQAQINNIRTQLLELSNIRIDLGGAGGGRGGAAAAARNVNEVTRAYRELINISNRIGGKQQRIAGLDTTRNQREIMELSNQITMLDRRYQELMARFSQGFSPAQIDNLNRRFQITSENINLVNRKVADVKANLASGITSNFTSYEAQIVSLEGKFNSLATKPPEIRAGLDSLRQALATLRDSDSTDALISNNEAYLAILKQVQAQLNLNAATEKNSADTIALQQGKEQALLRLHGLFENGSQAARMFSNRVKELDRQIRNCGNKTGLTQANREIDILSRQIKIAGVQTQTFGTRLKNQLSQYATYFSGYMLFTYAIQGLRSMFEQVKSIDSAMTELKKVTDETDATYDRFLSNAASRAKEIGTTIDGLVSSTADFARLGYGFEDAQGLAEVANIYAVVGDEIENVEQATKSLISTMAAFRDSAGDMSNTDFAMSIIDKFNEVGNHFAISSGGIGDALERSASSLDAANNTLDESIALITAANTVVQDPDKVGTAFKTISMRIRGAKTELEEAGLEADGMVESTAKLRQEILALSGVDIMENNDTFKSTYKIMEELAAKWQNLTDIQQATITELIAGKRQGNIVSSLMTNFDVAQKALQTSLKSAGSAMTEHEKWQKSIEAHINSLKASWQSLSQSFLKSKSLKFLLTTVTKLLDLIDKLIDNFGVLGTAIGGIGLYNFGKAIIPTLSQAAPMIAKTTNNFNRMGKIAGAAGKRMWLAFQSFGRVLAIMGAIKAVTDIISWLSDSSDKAETAAEKFDRLSEELSSVESDLSGLESELSTVESQIDTLLSKDELSFADEEELGRLKRVSSELEHQIQLTETLQKSLQKSLSDTALNAYSEYSKETSFYSKDSKSERKEQAKEMGSSIGNIVGLVIGGIIGAVAGGNVLLGAGIGSAAGSALGGGAGAVIGKIKYSNEISVEEMLDRMRAERARLEKAQEETYEAYTKDRSASNKKDWEEATTALNDYNAALSNHISQLSEYYNSVDYASLTTDKQRQEYIKMGDELDKYNIDMGVKGAKSTAFDRIFDEEFITEEAEELKQYVQAALNSGKDIEFYDFDSDQFVEMKNRLADMGLTLTDVINYFVELEEAQEDASNYETYDMVSNIAALSDGVTALTDAFAEFNEQGIVTAETLAELHGVFGSLGEDWTNYVDVVTNGIASIDDIREATEKLVESYTDDLFKSGGIKFAKFNEETDKYEFNEDGYKTYLSTINELENLGVENAKEYTDALQQQAMIREATSKMRADSAEKELLLAKEKLETEEETRLVELESKKINDYISEIESSYGIRFKDKELVEKQFNLENYQSKVKEYKKYLSDINANSDEYKNSIQRAIATYDDIEETQKKIDALRAEGYNTKDGSLNEAKSAFTEVFTFGIADTKYDEYDRLQEELDGYVALSEQEAEIRKDFFGDLIKIAKDEKIDLSDIDIKSFDPYEYGRNSIFNKVYEKVKSELEADIDEYEKNIEGLSSEIETRLNNLGLEVDFGRNFDKIIIDGLKGKLDKFSTAKSEMLSGSGLSTDSIIAIDEIFGDLSSYDSSKLFENTLNGVRLNTEEFKRLSDEIKDVNIGALENKMSDLGDQYVKTRDELNKLTYGTIEYQEKARELDGIAAQIEANEELLSQYQALFSSYQEWQRAESAGSERGMYETILSGFETVSDEISRGWVDEGTREFLELLKGDTATIVNGKGEAKEINIATASAKELKQVWKDLDDTIEHTTYSVRDFFTIDEDGNSTSQGVYNFLDAIGQMEEEKFLDKDGKPIDVVKRNDEGNIIGFDFQIVGGDKAIAEALGISEELVQIMKRAAIDAGFVVTFDGSFEQLDVLKEKAEVAAKEMNEILKADGKTTIDIDMNVDSVEKIQPQLDKIMETFGKKDKNGKLTGEIDMGIKGADKAIGIARTLQSMKDELTRPAYMDIQIGQVEEELRDPLYKLQQLRTYIEQEHQLKLGGGDTSQLEESKQEIYDYFEELSPEIKAKIGLVDENGNGLTEESFNKMTAEQKIKVGYVDEDGKPIEDYSEALRKKLGDGSLSIEATIDLQLEMSESLDILAQTALFEQGKISEEEYNKRISIYLDAEVEEVEVDTSKIEELLEERGLEKDQQINILAMAEVLGAEDIETLAKKLDGLTDKQIQVLAEVLGRVDVEKLKTTVAGLDDKTVEAIAKALGEGDVEGLKTTIKGLDDKTVQAIAEAFGYDGVDELNKAIDNLDPKTVQAIAEALGITDVDSLKAAIDRLSDKNVKATATVFGKNKIDDLKSAIDKIKDKTVTITTKVKKFFTNVFGGGNEEEGDSDVNGTAHVNGTAFKQGSWGTKNSGTALVGELGRETLVRDGRYYTIGNNGAEFIKYKKGDIIFNHKQTEELFNNGRVTSGGGRAKALSGGTAFANGSYPSSGAAFNNTNYKWDGVGEPIMPDPSLKEDKDKDKDKDRDFEETIDWVEIILERVERSIDKFDQQTNNIYKNWSYRNKALANEISEIGKEIGLQEQAKNTYLAKANSIGLPESYASKVRNGDFSIEDFKGEADEELVKKIKSYQEWYEKALDCEDAIAELKETEAKLYAQRVENAAVEYEGVLGVIEHEKSMIEEYISQSETNAMLVSGKYYEALMDSELEKNKELENQRAAMLEAFNEAMDSGAIEEGSEAYYDMVNSIDEVTLAIEESNTALAEFEQTLQQINWEVFDILQERISGVTEEADFLIELMSSSELFDDKGNLTDKGKAAMGLHGQNYNTYMHQADYYGAEAEELNKQIAEDPYDLDLINRRDEMLKLQRESILAAEGEKEAIRDLVSEGIELELDALQELIDKKNEQLESEKDLYDYQKKVKEQTKEIASLEKQLAAYSGDDSEEARQKIQQIKVDLESAKSDLEETEMDRLISDTSAVLDELYLSYEEILNTRLDNLDYLIEQVITEINADAGIIGDTIRESADSVGYTLTESMKTIWNEDSVSTNNVITTYGEKFVNAQTTTNAALQAINTNLQNMITYLNKSATTKVKTATTSSASKSSAKKPTTTTTTKKSTSGGDGKPKIGDKVKFVSGQYYYDSQGQKPLGSKHQGEYVYITNINTRDWATHGYHISTGNKLGKGDLGWLKLNQISGYAVGKKNFLDNEIAWTQENGQEFIIRPSDGAILTPIAKGDSVLTSAASSNIWNMANNPSEFIKDNLNLGATNIPNNSNVNNNITQNVNANLNFPNVKSYEEMLISLSRDPKFQKLVNAMTTDQYLGKTSLAKGKAIR